MKLILIIITLCFCFESAFCHNEEAKEFPFPNDILWESTSDSIDGAMPIGNGYLKADVWVKKGNDGGIFIKTEDYGTYKISLKPCVWDITFSQKLDFKSGVISICNAYAKFFIFVDIYSPSIWIKGKTESALTVELENQSLLTIESGRNQSFTVCLSNRSVSEEKKGYLKSERRTSLYWEEFWNERGYMLLQTSDTTTGEYLTEAYNIQRWIDRCKIPNSTPLHLIRSLDWDIVKEYIHSLNGNYSEEDIHLMMEYVKYSKDESYLNKYVIAAAREYIPKSKLIVSDFQSLPNNILIPEDIFLLLPANRLEIGNEPIQLKVNRNDRYRFPIYDSVPKTMLSLQQLAEECFNSAVKTDVSLTFQIADQGRHIIRGIYKDSHLSKGKRKSFYSADLLQ